MALKINTEDIRWFRKQRQDWGNANFRDLPGRRTTDPYRLLVAECLLQKTTASQVQPIFERVLKKYPEVEDLAHANPDELLEMLRPLGLLKRSTFLRAAAGMVVDEYGGEVPDSEKELLKLPGVGLYVARSILANAYGT